MGPEKGRFIPISETKPFNTPEGNHGGSVAVLDKPEEIKESINISSTKPISSPMEINIDMGRGSKAIKTIKDKEIHVLKIEPMESPKEAPVKPDPVDWHEAAHIAVGLYGGVPIKYASSIATAEFDGVTIPSRYNAPMAAAGGATKEGGGGDGHDRMVIRMHGDDPDSARSVARSILASIPKQRRALAEGLKKKGILHSHEINWIYKNADKEDEEENKPKETMYEVIVKGKDGEERERVVLPEDQTVLNVSLPQSGNIFVANKDNLASRLSSRSL